MRFLRANGSEATCSFAPKKGRGNHTCNKIISVCVRKRKRSFMTEVFVCGCHLAGVERNIMESLFDDIYWDLKEIRCDS